MTLESPFDRYSLENPNLHEAGYDSYITAWVYQQMMKIFEDLEHKCKDRLNLMFSFYFIDLRQDEDIINTYVNMQ